MSGKLRWGILGTGGIAKALAKALAVSTTGELVAVGSRTQAAADKFGDEFKVAKRYASYDGVLSDAGVDAVYISLPNHMHAEWAIKTAEAGKHVLCEKPLTTNWAEGLAVVEAARRAKVFFMEAFMYRCHPQTAKLVELLRSKVIGEVRVIQANFSYNMGPKFDNIRLRADAAGGGIMDVGCYTVSMSRMIAGVALGKDFADPIEVKGAAHIGDVSKVDEWAVATLKFPGDILATCTTGCEVGVDNVIRIYGSTGSIEVPNPWFPGRNFFGDGSVPTNKIFVRKNGSPEEIVEIPGDKPLYTVEVDTVAQAVKEGKVEAPHPAMSWNDSLGNMLTLDLWRKAVGLEFDLEKFQNLHTTVANRPLKKRYEGEMSYQSIPGVSKPISRAVMGSMIFSKDSYNRMFALLDYFFEIGGNAIDMANYYGEPGVGDYLRVRKNREQWVLMTKGAHTPECDPVNLSKQLKLSLERVGVEYFDLYAMHRDNLDIPVGEFVDVLNEHKNAGHIRVFGGSNWSTARLDAANEYARKNGKTGFTISSPNLSLARWNHAAWAGCISASDPESLAWYEKNQMPLFAWTSQAQGLFAGVLTQPGSATSPDGYIRLGVEVWVNDKNRLRLERAQELAAKKGVHATQIALAYVLNQPFPTFALMGPRTIEECRTSVAGVGLKLTRDECRWLNLEI